MLFEHYFEHSSKWTNLLFQLLNSPSVKNKYILTLWTKYLPYLVLQWYFPWVSPGMGLFHQQFFKTIFGFGSMWQLRISHLNFDVFLATNELVFNMLLRVWMLEEKHWTTQRQLETLFIHVAASQFLVPNQSFLWNDTPCKGVGLGELSPCSKLSKGPCMDLSLHVPNSYLRVVFNYLILTWELIVRFPMDPNTAYVLESRLISMDGATQIPILECEATRWHNSKVCVCWYFRSGNSKAFYCPPNTSSRQKIAAAHT